MKPEFAQTLKQLLSRKAPISKGGRSRPASKDPLKDPLKEVCERVNEKAGHEILTVPMLQSYRSGARVPPTEIAGPIAEYLLGNDLAKKESFLKSLDSERETRRKTTRGTNSPLQLRALASKQRRLNISTIHYSAVSHLLPNPPGGSEATAPRSNDSGSSKAGFVDRLFLLFLKLSGIDWKSIKRDFSGDVQTELDGGKIDVALSYFTSIDRNLLVRFWPLPIRLTMGVLCDKNWNNPASIKLIREALSYEKSPNPEVFPIVLKSSVSSVHCSATLGYTETGEAETDTMGSVRGRDWKLYHEAYGKALDKGNKIPVLVDDELALAEMLAATDPQTGNLKYPNYFPVLPLTSEHTASENKDRRESPIFYASIACSRSNDQLWQFLDDALRLLLQSEVYTTSEAYRNLYFELLATLKTAASRYRDVNDSQEKSVPGAGKDLGVGERLRQEAEVFARAHQWVMHALHLTRTGIEQFTEARPYWKSILTRSRMLVLGSLAGAHAHQVRQLIQSNRPSRPLRDDEVDPVLKRLEEVLDIEIRLEPWERRYAALRTVGLEEVVIQRLGPKTVPAAEIFRVSNHTAGRPLEAEFSAGVLDLLKDYCSSEFADVRDATEIREVRENPSHFLKRCNAQCLTALWEKRGDDADLDGQILGTAFLIPAKKRPGEYELAFFWVGSSYRNMGVGRKIISTAVAQLESLRANRLFVRIPASTNGVLTSYFRKSGFEVVKSDSRAEIRVSRAIEAR